MTITWKLKDQRITMILVCGSKVSQLPDFLQSLDYLTFESSELDQIDAILMA
jgi:aryl-alcohol dehydrogenase-like predicted oxidoreductase